MTLLDLMRSWDHLTMREVAMVEHFRETWAADLWALAGVEP